jgi:hypothetical protein
MEQAVEKIATLSRSVAEQHATMEAAFDEERAAEEELLEKLVDAVRPALRALSSRLKASETTLWPTSTETSTEKTSHPERGVRLDGNGPERDHPRANDGSIGGTDLVLLDDGTFARLDWTGTWTRWQGRTSEETSTLTRITLRDVVETWDVDEIAATLSERLEAQLAGRATKTTAASKDRAEKLRAVAALLGGRG